MPIPSRKHSRPIHDMLSFTCLFLLPITEFAGEPCNICGNNELARNKTNNYGAFTCLKCNWFMCDLCRKKEISTRSTHASILRIIELDISACKIEDSDGYPLHILCERMDIFPPIFESIINACPEALKLPSKNERYPLFQMLTPYFVRPAGISYVFDSTEEFRSPNKNIFYDRGSSSFWMMNMEEDESGHLYSSLSTKEGTISWRAKVNGHGRWFIDIITWKDKVEVIQSVYEHVESDRSDVQVVLEMDRNTLNYRVICTKTNSSKGVESIHLNCSEPLKFRFTGTNKCIFKMMSVHDIDRSDKNEQLLRKDKYEEIPVKEKEDKIEIESNFFSNRDQCCVTMIKVRNYSILDCIYNF